MVVTFDDQVRLDDKKKNWQTNIQKTEQIKEQRFEKKDFIFICVEIFVFLKENNNNKNDIRSRKEQLLLCIYTVYIYI